MEDDYLGFEACNRERAADMLNYIFKLSRNSYNGLGAEVRSSLLETHRHLKECSECRRGYRGLKGKFAMGEVGDKFTFSSEDFRVLRENEEYLEGIAKK